MRRLLYWIVLLSVAAVFINAQAGFRKGDIRPWVLKDFSTDNQSLVVVSFTTIKDLFGTRPGPSHLTFCKVDPVVGQRFTPIRGSHGKNSLNDHLFFFDQANAGESYKIYDYNFTEGNIIAGFTDYHMVPGLMGSEGLVTINKPGIHFMGAWQQSTIFNSKPWDTESRYLRPDPGITEIMVMRALLENLNDFPGWKALVQKRVEELSK